MNESDELFEKIRDCSQRLMAISNRSWDGMLSCNDANELSAIIGELRDIARELQHGPQ